MPKTLPNPAALADLLRYPWDERPRIGDPALAAQLRSLARFLESESLEDIQDLYTRTFDLTPVAPPYLAFHQHGETYRRGSVMASLRELYRNYGVDEGQELPDHLASVLRLVAVASDDPAVQALVRSDLLPGHIKLEAALAKEDPKNPYCALFAAAREALEACAS